MTITLDKNEDENENPQNKTEGAENTCMTITEDANGEAA
jgi:hypothetical protein